MQKGESLFASVLSASIRGMEVCPIKVEADVSNGLPSFIMVGFPSTQVKEAQDRVRTALKNNGISLPPRKVTVNFAPADIRKEGAGFDMPVAAAVLAASGVVGAALLEGVMMAGEISLNGHIHGISGVLPMVIRARDMGCRLCIIPHENLPEGRLVHDMPVAGVKNIIEMMDCLKHPQSYTQRENSGGLDEEDEELPDFEEVEGQQTARRAAEIAVSGFHNILFIGQPGTGKTMIARRLPSIMPELTFEESLELTRIYSIAGRLSKEHPLIRRRPFRSPHHTSSAQAMTGGGRNPRPGEVTLAHRGVLFLDEMPEFSRKSLETLRQPLEDKMIQLSRVNGTYVFPANFILAAAMNPCPCGYYPDMNRCRCTAGQVSHYLGKISRPLLDRIDICTEVPPVSFTQLRCSGKNESSEVIRRRVEKVRKIQSLRYKNETVRFNGELHGKQIQTYCPMTADGAALLGSAFEKMQFSARSYHRILKVARTIADMEEEEMIGSAHIGEALAYRVLDGEYRS
ncbi:MAG: YifB family Mg chelatase-like AAA ATPase [Eubacteriales bacterium]|nr:YifB family Mg chelatase-like AAA ATPase [Eubacteriales bacterium]